MGSPLPVKPAKADNPTAQAYEAAAWALMCDPLALRAIAAVEAGPEGAFLPSGEPVILFERHLFSRYTSRRYDGVRGGPEHALLSHREPGGYGSYGVQHAKLQAAAELDRDAALRACSWGLFQILGNNHAECGYPELQRFITAMYRSADDHLRALVRFIRHDARKVDALRAKDWAAFAYLYNGPAYERNQYDVKMAKLYAQLEAAA